MVLKTLEAHGAIIRSYYAAKFYLTTVDFSSPFKDTHPIHEHTKLREPDNERERKRKSMHEGGGESCKDQERERG